MERCEVSVEGVMGVGKVLRSAGVREVEGLFGVQAGGQEGVWFEGVRVQVGPGEVVALVGGSGAGKSTLLRRLAAGLRARGVTLFDAASVPMEDKVAVVDALGVPTERALACCAMAGLSEARLVLRAPAELSEGEQHRFRLAAFFASAAEVLVMDEFTSSLDRVTAKAIAWQLGRHIRRSVDRGFPRSAIVATVHGDVLADLGASVVVRVGMDRRVVVEGEDERRKTKDERRKDE